MILMTQPRLLNGSQLCKQNHRITLHNVANPAATFSGTHTVNSGNKRMKTLVGSNNRSSFDFESTPDSNPADSFDLEADSLRDVDSDLLEVLEIASDNELQDIYRILYDPSLFSPLGKSLQSVDEVPLAIHYRGRASAIRLIEQRFRFLAADALSTLRGRWPTYRETLLNIRERLSVPCPTSLETSDLESEIFLHLLAEHSDAVDAKNTETSAAAASVVSHAYDGDGMAPIDYKPKKANVLSRLLTPLKLGFDEVLPVVSKLGASLAVTNLHVNVAKKLGSALVQKTVQYEAAVSLAVSAGAKGLKGTLQAKLGVQAAQKGLTTAAARYAAARSVLALVGPIMWASTLIDLMVMSLGTDYARIVKCVFALSQIRLLRTKGWTQGGLEQI